MALNSRPEENYMECGQATTKPCPECLYEEEKWGTLCEEHAGEHTHDEYGEPLDLVPPRLELCDYTGPAEPPY